MSSAPLKLGLLGAGMISTHSYGYLPNLHRIASKAVLSAVADPVVDRARAVASQYGASAAFATLEEMLAGADVDVVVNLTPIPFHGAHTLTALRAGKHVVSEKPIATSMADADAIVELANDRGLTVVCAPPNMLEPVLREVKRLVAEGAVGKVCFARVRSSHGGPAANAWPMDPTWFYQKGSGPLFDMGVYGLHEITGILGPAKRVVAFSGITEPIRHARGGPFHGKEITVTEDDNTLLMLDFGGSTFAVVDGTFNVNAAKSPRTEIFGRTGTINLPDYDYLGGDSTIPFELFRLDALAGVDGWITPNARSIRQAQQHFDQLARTSVIEHLVDCVRTREKPILSAEHARHTLEIMLAARESATSGRAIDLRTAF
jgi:predicted dehydrogenase